MKITNKDAPTIFFTSDLHFGHEGIIKMCNRPFQSLEEMDETLIKNWNSLVKPKDKVYVLGDFFMYYKKPKLREILNRLNGTKILIKGNHDMTDREMENLGFSFVCRSATLMIANELVELSHYPYKKTNLEILFWKALNKIFPKKFFKPRVFHDMLTDRGRFLLHGHSHSKNRYKDRMIHVGVDAWKYKPVALHEIGNLISEIKRKELSGFSKYVFKFKRKYNEIFNILKSKIIERKK